LGFRDLLLFNGGLSPKHYRAGVAAATAPDPGIAPENRFQNSIGCA